MKYESLSSCLILFRWKEQHIWVRFYGNLVVLVCGTGLEEKICWTVELPSTIPTRLRMDSSWLLVPLNLSSTNSCLKVCWLIWINNRKHLWWLRIKFKVQSKNEWIRKLPVTHPIMTLINIWAKWSITVHCQSLELALIASYFTWKIGNECSDLLKQANTETEFLQQLLLFNTAWILLHKLFFCCHF